MRPSRHPCRLGQIGEGLHGLLIAGVGLGLGILAPQLLQIGEEIQQSGRGLLDHLLVELRARRAGVPPVEPQRRLQLGDAVAYALDLVGELLVHRQGLALLQRPGEAADRVHLRDGLDPRLDLFHARQSVGGAETLGVGDHQGERLHGPGAEVGGQGVEAPVGIHGGGQILEQVEVAGLPLSVDRQRHEHHQRAHQGDQRPRRDPAGPRVPEASLAHVARLPRPEGALAQDREKGRA